MLTYLSVLSIGVTKHRFYSLLGALAVEKLKFKIFMAQHMISGATVNSWETSGKTAPPVVLRGSRVFTDREERSPKKAE